MRLKTKFQDEDFDLGEVVEANVYYGGSGRVKVIAEAARGGDHTFYFETLKWMNEMFEDAEEPKQWYGLNAIRDVGFEPLEYEGFEDLYKHAKELGIAFDTRKEAEKAVEKLKAWKRLKDKGFRFNGVTPMGYFIRFTYDKPRQILDNQQHPEVAQQFNKDLDLLFGGEK